mgnify:CR=1 FL=1
METAAAFPELKRKRNDFTNLPLTDAVLRELIRDELFVLGIIPKKLKIRTLIEER